MTRIVTLHLALILLCSGHDAISVAQESEESPEISGDTLKVWVFSDAHVGTDIEHGVESLAEAIRQSEQGLSGVNPAPPMDWDLGICLGDFARWFRGAGRPGRRGSGTPVQRSYDSRARANLLYRR